MPIRLLSTLFALLLLASCTQGDLPSKSQKAVYVLSWSTGLEADFPYRYQKPIYADFNKDGYDDILIQLRAPHVPVIAFGTPKGFKAFKRVRGGRIGGYKSDRNTIIGDFNADGFADQFIQNRKHAEIVSLNNRHGKFLKAKRWLSGDNYMLDKPAFPGDINGDGCDDLVIESINGKIWTAIAACNNKGKLKNSTFGRFIMRSETPDYSKKNKDIFTARINNDKRDDLVYLDCKTSLIMASITKKQLKNGAAFKVISDFNIKCRDVPYNLIPVDVNNDRLDDLFLQAANGNIYILLNKNGRFRAVDYAFSGVPYGRFSYFAAKPGIVSKKGLNVLLMSKDHTKVYKYLLPIKKKNKLKSKVK